MEGPVLHFSLDELATPVQVSARRLPVAMKEPVRQEWTRLEKLGIIAREDGPVDWTSPIVIAHKKNGKIRVCIDPRELNKHLQRTPHPVPTVEGFLPDVRNAKVFSKCDVKNGFWHVGLDEASSRLLTFATPFGRFRWTRMPFGIAPAPEIFQRRLEQQLEGLPGVSNIHDDILIMGEGETLEMAIDNHDKRLNALLKRCEDKGIVLNSNENFCFRQTELPGLYGTRVH